MSVVPALLMLSDGTEFEGESVGYDAVGTGEVVFNTALSGYQEVLTDPSYAGQVITFTYPHIGNYGTNPADERNYGIPTQLSGRSGPAERPRRVNKAIDGA